MPIVSERKTKTLIVKPLILKTVIVKTVNLINDEVLADR